MHSSQGICVYVLHYWIKDVLLWRQLEVGTYLQTVRYQECMCTGTWLRSMMPAYFYSENFCYIQLLMSRRSSVSIVTTLKPERLGDTDKVPVWEETFLPFVETKLALMLPSPLPKWHRGLFLWWYGGSNVDLISNVLLALKLECKTL
jgi:hypothetical protein